MIQELNIPNLDKLIAHLEAQPPERINMTWGVMQITERYGECGCIIAHTRQLFSAENICAVFGDVWPTELIKPEGWENEATITHRRYPAHRVIATLKRLRDRFLATGEIVVDWGPEPGSEPAQPWSAPQAIETPPTLPASITRLLAPEPTPAAEEI